MIIMVGLREPDIVKVGVAFRNRMNKTNCSLEDIMRIYIGKPVADYFRNDSQICGFVPHRKKLKRKKYFV